MPANPASILDSVKKALGLDSSDTSYDLDVVMFTNSAFGPLQQVGVGPDTGFVIQDNTKQWSQYTSRIDLLGMIQQFIYQTVKLAFDPPPTSFAVQAINEQLNQLIWRIYIGQQQVVVVDALPSVWWDLTGLSDFPSEAATGDFGVDLISGDVWVKDQLLRPGYWWDLTGLSDFPVQAVIGEIGYDTTTGDVWIME